MLFTCSQHDVGAVWQICQLITAKEMIKETCNPAWLSWDVKAPTDDNSLRGEKLKSLASLVCHRLTVNENRFDIWN